MQYDRVKKEFEYLFEMAFQIRQEDVKVTLGIEEGMDCETSIETGNGKISIYGQDRNKLLCGIYSFFESLGVQFLITGEVFCRDEKWNEIPERSLRLNASVKNRGIRMHLNFVQDQSFASREDLASQLPQVIKNRDIWMAQICVLDAIYQACQEEAQGNEDESVVRVTRLYGLTPVSENQPVRELPKPEIWFETVWEAYRERRKL